MGENEDRCRYDGNKCRDEQPTAVFSLLENVALKHLPVLKRRLAVYNAAVDDMVVGLFCWSDLGWIEQQLIKNSRPNPLPKKTIHTGLERVPVGYCKGRGSAQKA